MRLCSSVGRCLRRCGRPSSVWASQFSVSAAAVLLRGVLIETAGNTRRREKTSDGNNARSKRLKKRESCARVGQQRGSNSQWDDERDARREEGRRKERRKNKQAAEAAWRDSTPHQTMDSQAGPGRPCNGGHDSRAWWWSCSSPSRRRLLNRAGARASAPALGENPRRVQRFSTGLASG